jgi:hypothetical protein
MDLKIYRKIYRLAYGFLFFVISISGRAHQLQLQLCYRLCVEVD